MQDRARERERERKQVHSGGGKREAGSPCVAQFVFVAALTSDVGEMGKGEGRCRSRKKERKWHRLAQRDPHS
jgi:hypothetical protein